MTTEAYLSSAPIGCVSLVGDEDPVYIDHILLQAELNSKIYKILLENIGKPVTEDIQYSIARVVGNCHVED